MVFNVVEICAGAGGQALGLHAAGFQHDLAVELDENAARTLTYNFARHFEGRDCVLGPDGKVIDSKTGDAITPREVNVAIGDVADVVDDGCGAVWKPEDHKYVSLLAGGVPCPPFTIAGKQLGANDERDLFAWAVEQVRVIEPRALMLENVRGLSLPRFAGYRQHVLDVLTELKYVAEWRLLQASDFGVPQLRPRFVLVALREEDAPYFRWPKPQGEPPTVGNVLKDYLSANGWEGAAKWAEGANRIAPTIVGGSKKHGGADLGPTRAKREWRQLGVDALGVADDAPLPKAKFDVGPKLTVEMVARLQGFPSDDEWHITGRKTSRYRQIGNAFPPPVAKAVGEAIIRAFKHVGKPSVREPIEHDPVYRMLRDVQGPVTAERLQNAGPEFLEIPVLEHRISLLGKDFNIIQKSTKSGATYELGEFKGFMGQESHMRHEAFLKNRARIS